MYSSSSQKIRYRLASLLLSSGALDMKIFYIFLVLASSVSAEKSNLEDPVLFCDGCFAMVSEIEKDMSVRSGGS